MKVISKISLLTIIITLLLTAVACAAPLRIALLPIYNYKCYTILDPASSESLYRRINQDIHVPLNGVLQRTEEIDKNVAAMAFNQARESLLAENKKAKLAEAIAPAAEQLNADVLILPVAKNCRQEIYNSTRGERILICYANLDMYVFEKSTGDLRVYRASESFESSYDSTHTLPASLMRCTEKVLKKAELRKLIPHD